MENNEKLTITLQEKHSQCGDGCCGYWDTYFQINNGETIIAGEDTATIIESILTELGLNVEVIWN
jgi:hypothetical protein